MITEIKEKKFLSMEELNEFVKSERLRQSNIVSIAPWNVPGRGINYYMYYVPKHPMEE